MINLLELGARPVIDNSGHWNVSFGIYLPGITFNKGYRLKVRIIHERDQFIRGIEPIDFDMSWNSGSTLDLWEAIVPIKSVAGTNFGQNGRYLYRYQLLQGNKT